MKLLIILSLSAVFIAGCSNLKNKEDKPQVGSSGMLDNFFPVTPYTFDHTKYTTAPTCNGISDGPPAPPIKRTKCWLDSLPNSQDVIYVTDRTQIRDGRYLTSEVSAANRVYEITSQWSRYGTARPLDNGAPNLSEQHIYGVGARIIAKIKTNKAGINLGDLFAVAVAASSTDVQGSLFFEIIGIHGKGVDTYTPKISKLDTENLQRAVESIQSIKTLLHNDDDIELTAQVLLEERRDEIGIDSVDEKNKIESTTNSDIKRQGWVYIGHFGANKKPKGPTNLVVENSDELVEGAIRKTRVNLNVRAGYPKFPRYINPEVVHNIPLGEEVRFLNVVNIGLNKFWALVEYSEQE